MAEDLTKLEAELKKINKLAEKYKLSAAKTAYDALKKAYAEVLKNEDEVISMLPAARESGVTGNAIKDFMQDAAFKKVFKAYDKTVDELDKAEKICYALTFNSSDVLEDLEKLKIIVEKEFKATKNNAFHLFLIKIEASRRAAAGSMGQYDYTKTDKKMHEYTTKFDKRVQFMLDLAPKSKDPHDDMPKELNAAAVEKAEKELEKRETLVKNTAKKVSNIIDAYKPFNRKAELLAKKETADIDATVQKMKKDVAQFKKMISDNKTTIKDVAKEERGHKKKPVDYDGFLARIELAQESSEKLLKKTQAELAEAQATLK